MKTICPYCGTNNPVERRLCRHCRKSLSSKGDPPSRDDDDIPAIVDSDNIDYSTTPDEEYDGAIYGEYDDK